MDTDDPIRSILDAIKDMQEDSTVPKNIKMKLAEIARLLQAEGELTMHVNKALDSLDDISDDTNLQPFTRTQLWNIASMLETLA